MTGLTVNDVYVDHYGTDRLPVTESISKTTDGNNSTSIEETDHPVTTWGLCYLTYKPVRLTLWKLTGSESVRSVLNN